MSGVWRVELFGGLRAVCGDQAVSRFRSQKTAALFAYLAFYRDLSHAREKLIEQFWPDADLNAGRNSLSTALSSLRQQFAIPSARDAELLVADRFSVRMDPALVETDVGTFETLLDAAAGQAIPKERVAMLHDALDLYRGELLAGLYEPWIYPEQQRLCERAFHTYRQVIAACTRMGNIGQALDFAHRSVALDPLREEAHQEVIRLYLHLNSGSQALRQYRELERVLRTQLDVGPADLTRAIVAHLLTDELTPVRGSGSINSPGVKSASPAPMFVPPWQTAGGALPCDSSFYVERPVDKAFHGALEQRQSIVLIKGARQTGKSSLLARGLERVRTDTSIVLTDFEALSSSEFASLEGLLLVLAQAITDQLGLDLDPADDWKVNRGPTLNFARFLRSVIHRCERPLVWAMDEVDRLFHCPFGDDLFALFRSWHNERALLPDAPWSRLTLAISYATEARLFIRDVNLSPFNVGTRLELGDFSLSEVGELNRRYGSPLETSAQLGSFLEWLGGHPYLSQRGLASLSNGDDLAVQSTEWDRGDGMFGEHLRWISSILTRSPELTEAVSQLLHVGRRIPEDLFYRLKSGGILAGASPDEACIRCKLYEVYLLRQLGSSPSQTGS